MEIVKSNKRQSIIDLVKFIAAVAIVYYHTLYGRTDLHFSMLYLLVELFFFITGYYTFSHFRKKRKQSGGESWDVRARNALKYTYKKFKAMMPYLIIAIVMQYAASIIIADSSQERLHIATGLPFEFLLLGTQAWVMNWPVWFISAMAIVMPLYCLICQAKNKHIVLLASLLACIVYYFDYFRFPAWNVFGISPLIRAFMGLLMGANIYIIAEHVRSAKRGLLANKKVSSIIEVSSIIFSFVLMYSCENSLNMTSYRSMILILFLIYLVIFFSGKTVFSSIYSPVCNYLGKLSMIIFMIHVAVLRFIELLLPESEHFCRAAVAICSSVVLSIIIYQSVGFVSSKLKKNRNNPTPSHDRAVTA